jgi:NAD(P)-dependent dehydrogenase (short-subunit alcohol dehydrogenase family)
VHSLFDLRGKTALITGAAGLLGPKHAEALLECGADVVLTDVTETTLASLQKRLQSLHPSRNISTAVLDVTSKRSVDTIFDRYNVDILVNNAAKDPKVKRRSTDISPETRFETMTEDFWREGLDVIVNGTFLCSQSFCNSVLRRASKGVIINMASDLGVISPDHRLYRQEGLPDDKQNVKPITYSAAKWAVVGMTKYLAVYFAEKGIRVNCLSPAGVYNDHPEEFVQRISSVIPMARMANVDEYKGAIMFLASDASSYMTGANLIIDGGRTVW